MECKCGSQAGDYRSGISKKNGKPWKGWKCTQCGEMAWIRDNASASTANPVMDKLDAIDKKLELIIKKLPKNELEPDDKVPF